MTCSHRLRSTPWLLALAVLGGCGDKGPTLTAGLTNDTFMMTFPSGPDSSNEEDDDDGEPGPTSGTGGTTSDEPTTAAPTSEPTTAGPTSGPDPTTAGPTSEPDPTTEDSSSMSQATPAPGFCGDGFVDLDEQCDDGNADDSDECVSCDFAVCGDGFVQEGVEACDDGDDDDDDGCSNNCVAATCGDGVVQAGEACDDGDQSNTDECLSSCIEAVCGDGVVWAGVEECDDGNADDTDDCTNDCTLNVQKYTAVGPQTNVPAANLTGWTICHSGPFNDESTTVSSILAKCNKANLMLACRPTGSTTYTLLAHAPRPQVIADIGLSNTPTNANGSGWYFDETSSWGFAKQGDVINRNTCDVENTNASLRLCFHTNLGSLQSGYRCGSQLGLFDTLWERVVLHAN